MHRSRVTLIVAVLAVAATAAFAVSSCSSKSKSPTNPGGGGGGTTGPSFNFTFPAVGASSSQVFATEGTFNYRCTPHASSGMTGSVIVSASASADSALVSVGPGSSLSFSPSTVTIKPGGLVRWVNQSSTLTIHTATR